MKYVLVILTLFLSACNTGEKLNEQPAVAETSTPVKPAALAGCYQMFIGQDSAFLRILSDTGSIRGKLAYKRFEKDSNDGTFEGVLQNNVIKGWYRFNSEGVISVRELFLKINGDTLAEGYGDLGMRSDTAFFLYPTTVNYEDKHPFVKVACTDKF
jgi:hypothetical protein